MFDCYLLIKQKTPILPHDKIRCLFSVSLYFLIIFFAYLAYMNPADPYRIWAALPAYVSRYQALSGW